jgi:hypothetical protein
MNVKFPPFTGFITLISVARRENLKQRCHRNIFQNQHNASEHFISSFLQVFQPLTLEKLFELTNIRKSMSIIIQTSEYIRPNNLHLMI